MSKLNLNLSLKKKSLLLTFLIVCSLLISENALAIYRKNWCVVNTYAADVDFITIYFKFFEYQPRQGGKCSYIKDFKIRYSTNNGATYEDLMTACTEAQTSNPWAWIECKDKKMGEKIEFNWFPHDVKPNSGGPLYWNDNSTKRFEVASETGSNELRFGVHWYPKCKATNIQIKVIWYDYMLNKTENVTLDYRVSL